VLIRKTVSSDRQALAEIIGCSDNLTDDEKQCAIELLDIYLNDPSQKDYFFMTAEDADGCQTGYVCYGPRPLAAGVYDLYWVVVAPERRRSGVARAMLENTVEAMKVFGARMLAAETSGTAAYQAARAFYLKSGFTEEARIKEFYKPGDDLVVYIMRF